MSVRPAPFAIPDYKIHHASIKNLENLTRNRDVKTVYKITLDTTGINHHFLPGDTIGIYPNNSEALVGKILLRLGLESVSEEPYEIKSPKKKHLPLRSTPRNLFLHHVDIQSVPKKLFLKSLIGFTEDPNERLELVELSSPKSTQYVEFITTNGTLLALLETFPSCHPPLEVLLQHLSPLLPRPYSIASSPLTAEIEIAFFVLVRDNGTKGLCTGWLEEGTNCVPFYFRQPSLFRLPEDPSIPLILIATGTGIAPFRAFLQHRRLQEIDSVIWLFYGCRYRDRDFLFRDEIEECVKLGVVSKLDVSFSREKESKDYVQDNIGRKGEEFYEWVAQKEARIFICGDVKTVVKDVRGAVVGVVEKFGCTGDGDAEYFVSQMEKEGRFIVDAWV